MPDALTALFEIVGSDGTEATVPEWVHLVPLGRVDARDGRRFVNDAPERVIDAFHAGRIELPIDYEHQTETLARANGPVPAAGWIKELELRDSGIWGRVDWTARARELIGNREYRFLSPALVFNKTTRRVIKLKGAGLVHNPALHITALASQEDTMDDDATLLQRLAAMLDLAEDADLETVIEALEARLSDAGKPDPREYAPVEALKDVMRERSRETALMSEERARAKVDDAFRRGYLTTPMRRWALELCKVDEAAFDTFLECSVPPYADLMRPTHTAGPPPGEGAAISASSEEAALCAQLGITPDQLRS